MPRKGAPLMGIGGLYGLQGIWMPGVGVGVLGGCGSSGVGNFPVMF